LIIEQIRTQQSNATSGPLVYTILLVPRATELCKKVLEDEGVAGDVTLSEVCTFAVSIRDTRTKLTISKFKMELIPVEDDLLSLEMDNVARDIFLVSFC